MSDKKKTEITEDSFDRRDFVKRAGRYSAFVAAAFIGASTTAAATGCLYVDYSDGAYSCYSCTYSCYSCSGYSVYSAYSNYSYSAYSAYSNYSNY